MYCPECGAEFRDGFTHCSDCDADLVAQQPAAKRDDLVPVYATRDINLIIQLKAAFKEAGIEAATQSGALEDLYIVPRTTPTTVRSEFWVRAEDEQRARELVKTTLAIPTVMATMPPGEREDQADTRADARLHLGLGAAIILNVFFLPFGILTMAVLLGETERGPQPTPAMTMLTLGVPLMLAFVTCLAWVKQMKIAPWLQLVPLVVLLAIAVSVTRGPRFENLFELIKEHALPIFAAVFGATGLAIIVSAAMPRFLKRGA